MNRVSRAMFRLLLRLQPADVRAEFGAAMLEDADRMVRVARASGAIAPVLRVWTRLLADGLLAAMRGARTHATTSIHHPEGSPARRTPMGVTLLQDFRYALRVLRRQPTFVAVAALTIAIGVSATATIFSAANSLLLRAPTGVADPGSLVTLHRIDAQGTSFHAFGIPAFRELAAANEVEELVGYDIFAGGMTLEEEAARVSGALVSGNYFQALGATMASGRMFTATEDNAPGQDTVAVISFSLWERLFSRAPDTIGREVRVNGRTFTIIGIAEEGFQGHMAVFPTEVWLPLSSQGLVFGLNDISD